jgi:hypothetical protein
MIEVSLDVPASPDQVFAVLADGWSYSGWVVGNSHIRDVDPGWPSVGCRIHHSAGAWPLQIEDVSAVVSVQPGRSLELAARLWRFGTATVRFTLTPIADGRETRVVLAEQGVRGPVGRIPVAIQRILLRPRNVETLSRLADLAVGRARLSHGTSETMPT